ncbi:MAG: tetratricopeptide repeat protein [Kovacikia sp.]
MSKQRSHRRALQPAASQSALKQPSDQEAFQAQLQGLVKQQKYRQALDEIKRQRQRHPEMEFIPSEAEIWLLRGQQDVQKGDYKQAETSFRRALEQGLQSAYYWLARSLVQLNRINDALEVVKPAFEQGQLPKDDAICYLKLLLLKGETATVETLISKQAKRFSAAQLHWVRGILALKAEQPDVALLAFQKIKRPLTPGDRPDVWIIYTQQRLGNWTAASGLLGLQTTSAWGFSLVEPKYLKHPLLQRLALFQRLETGKPPLNPADAQQADRTLQAAVTAMSLLQLIERDDYHNAAHVLLNDDRRSSPFPELAALRSPLLIKAGQQALQQGEPECTEVFWQDALTEKPFNPQLAGNLRVALHLNKSFQEEQRLLTRLIKWVEQDAKQHPQNWLGDRASRTLANLHCYLADAWMAMGRGRTAAGALQQAERLSPTSPEVIGRKGLMAMLDNHNAEAIRLMTQALEQGCRSAGVYAGLLNCWDELDNPQAKLEARRRFGKKFGDLNPEAEIEFEPWLDALYTQDYGFFSQLVKHAEQPDPPMQALQIFVKAVQGMPNSGGRVSLNQAQAEKQWATLLKPLSGEQQVPTLEAIALATQLFAKREKGIAALVGEYQKRLFALSEEYPAAKEAHLIVLAIKNTSGQKMEFPLRRYLESMPKPGNALAQLQLQVRKFGWIRTLIPFITEALQREPQNPLLLLAKATTYPLSMPEYDQLKQQGFELARRVQDAKALQAFREEEAFLNLRQTQAIMPDLEDLNDFDAEEMETMLENLIRQTLGQKVPRAELERMLPTLKRQIMSELPDFIGDEDEDEDGFSIGFAPPRKRRRSFLDL